MYKLIPKPMIKIIISIIIGLAVISNAFTGIWLFFEYLRIMDSEESEETLDPTNTNDQ
jgi:hypothetical protein